MAGDKKFPYTSRTKAAIRVAAVLVIVLLVAKFVMAELGVTDNNWAPQALPHSLPFPFSEYIFYLAIASLVAVWSFKRAGIIVSVLFNLIIVTCYVAWLHLSSSRTIYDPTLLNSVDAERRLLGLFNATVWDVAALALTAYVLVWELSVLVRRQSFRDSNTKPTA